MKYIICKESINIIIISRKPLSMKNSRCQTHRKYHSFPNIQFEEQSLTSFSGLIILQRLFTVKDVKGNLRHCFSHLTRKRIFGQPVMVLLLIIHLWLGFRRIRDQRYYQNDPLVRRIAGVLSLPDVSTLSRTLKKADETSVEKLNKYSRTIVLDRLADLNLSRITNDFDGSVISTKGHVENSAIGFNKKKKGCRSYYPLYSTIAQTGQVLDVLHRPGNVHDSNGSIDFVKSSFSLIHQSSPHTQIETRMDSAFFSEKMVNALEDEHVEYTISVPFERLPELKQKIEKWKQWHSIDTDTFYFELNWKPQSWSEKKRFIFIKHRVKKQQKEALQLDLFIPFEYGYEFKVILTNKKTTVRNVLSYHNGRGSQEGIFSELKSQMHMDYIPFKKLIPNKIYMLSAIIAHNMTRELHILTEEKARHTEYKRPALWIFQKVETFRNLVKRAGRITWPKGQFTLTIAAKENVKNKIVSILDALKKAA